MITFVLGGGVIREMSAAQMLCVNIALALFLISLMVEFVGARVYLVHGLYFIILEKPRPWELESSSSYLESRAKSNELIHTCCARLTVSIWVGVIIPL